MPNLDLDLGFWSFRVCTRCRVSRLSFCLPVLGSLRVVVVFNNTTCAAVLSVITDQEAYVEDIKCLHHDIMKIYNTLVFITIGLHLWSWKLLICLKRFNEKEGGGRFNHRCNLICKCSIMCLCIQYVSPLRLPIHSPSFWSYSEWLQPFFSFVLFFF